MPEWQGQVSASLAHGPLTLSLQARYTGATAQLLTQNVYQASLGRVRYDVLDNTINSSAILDSAFGYDFKLRNGNRMRLYANVNNLLDRDPEASYSVLSAFTSYVTNGYVGDLRGRRYALGLNFDF